MERDQVVLVPGQCPQCPDGGYDLVAGQRRRELLERLEGVCREFAADGRWERLLEGILEGIRRGLPPGEVGGLVIDAPGGAVGVRCRREGDEVVVELTGGTLVMAGSVVVGEIRPGPLAPVRACPLLAPGAAPACDSGACGAFRRLQGLTGAAEGEGEG